VRSLGGARHLLAVAGLLLVLGAAADSAEAGCPTPPAHRPKLLLHLVAGTSKNPCADLPVLPECSGTSATAQRAGRLAPEEYIAYIVLSRAAREPGIASVKFGLGYDNPLDVGVDIEGWDHCGDAVIAGPGWPASADASPLSSLTVFWAGDDCRRDPMPADTSLAHVIVGWLRVRAVTQDILGFAGENLVDTQMSDCDGATSRLSSLDLGSVSFTASGAGGGFDPCDSYKPGPGCVIAGPAAVAPGASVLFETGGLCCSVTHTSWSVSGEATVAGQSSGLTFGVLAGQEGTFEVTFNYSGTESGGCCSRTITIDPSLPVVPTTWGRIKVLVR
jgi:hypothetical protein